MAAVLLVYVQTRGFAFVNFDDPDYVAENVHVQKGLTPAGIAWAFRADDRTANWHPLTWLSLMLDCQLYGPRWAGGFHLTNMLLHAANSVLLLLVLCRMTGDIWPSALVAAVFAVHPLHVESVAWIAERKDVLSGLLFMLSLCCYVRYTQRPESWGRYACVAAVYAVGLTAKPMLVTLPFVFLLLDYWPLRRVGMDREMRGKWRLVAEKWPLFALSAISCLVTLVAQCSAMKTLVETAPANRVANAVTAYVTYLEKSFCPTALAAHYPLPTNSPPNWQTITAIGFLAAVTAVSLATRRKLPYLFVGWLWFLGMLAPVVGLVQVGDQALADRYTYLPQIGLCIALVWSAAGLVGRCRGMGPEPSKPDAQARWTNSHLACASGFDHRYLCAACCIGVSLLLAVLASLAWQQVSYWRDSETLWTHALECTSRNFMAHFKLARALESDEKPRAAMQQYRMAVEIKPGDAAARNNLGNLLAGRGELDAAIKEYEAGVEFNPRNLELQFNLATLLAQRGRFAAAVVHYKRALEIAPNFAAAKTGLARAGRPQSVRIACRWNLAPFDGPSALCV